MSIWGWFGGVFKKIGKAFLVLFKSAAMEFVLQNKELAFGIILQLATTDYSSSEKRSRAFNDIKDKVTNAGDDFKDHFINLLIEMTVAELKAQKKLQ